MNNARLAQAAGACALMGGSAWTSATTIHAFQPRGCIADECALRPMREATTGTSWLIAVSALAMIGFLVALLLLVRRSSDLGWTGIAGVTACGFGVAALVLGAVVPQLRDFRWALPGGAALAVGLALLGWTVLRSHVVPTWAGIGLLVGTALLVGFNEQTSRVLLALPFGLAWLSTGVALMLRSGTTPVTGNTAVDQS